MLVELLHARGLRADGAGCLAQELPTVAARRHSALRHSSIVLGYVRSLREAAKASLFVAAIGHTTAVSCHVRECFRCWPTNSSPAGACPCHKIEGKRTSPWFACFEFPNEASR